MKSFVYTSLIIIVLLSSCNNHKELNYSVINVSSDSAQIFEIPSSSKVTYFTNNNADSSLIIGNIYKLDFSGDTMIVFSKDRVTAINGDGNYLHDFSTKGRGPLEFLTLNSVFLKNGLVHLYDDYSKKILRYYVNGSFCDSINIPVNKDHLSINRIIPIYESNRYVFRPVFRGEQFNVPKLGLLDSTFRIIDTLAGEYLKTGISFVNTFTFNGDEVIYWEPFCYSIISIDSNLSVRQKYYVNFNEYALSSDILKKNINEIITLINNKDNLFKYVTSIYDVYETKNYVIFRYSLRQQNYLAIYIKHKNSTKSFEIKKDGYLFSSFTTVHNEKIYLIANEEGTNRSALFCIDFKDIIN